MGGNASERLSWKEPLHSLEVELEREFGLNPVQCRALLRRLGEFLDAFVEGQAGARKPGQVVYPAVAVGERAGKPLRYCLTIPVLLTVIHPSDPPVLHEQGSPSLRRVRLARMCVEAHRQGTALSHEDLSLLLGVEISTIRRMVRLVGEEGERPPTRGFVDDIGPTVSHKDQVLRLYFEGHLPARIAARTGHSLGSVERYLSDFARVVELEQRGLAQAAIVRITGLSTPVVRSYLSLFQQVNVPGHRPVLDRLLRRFGPVETADIEEVPRG